MHCITRNSTAKGVLCESGSLFFFSRAANIYFTIITNDLNSNYSCICAHASHGACGKISKFFDSAFQPGFYTCARGFFRVYFSFY